MSPRKPSLGPVPSFALLVLWSVIAGVFIGRFLPAIPLPGGVMLVVVALLITAGMVRAGMALGAHLRGQAVSTERGARATAGGAAGTAAPASPPRHAAAPATAPAGRMAEVEPVTVHADARGIVLEPATPGMLPGQRNVHLVTSAPGAIRGNHYHERGTEVAVVVGPALVRLRESGVVRDVDVPAGAAWRFTIPPRVSHAFQNTGDRPMVLVAFNTVEHDPAAPDVFRDVLIGPTA
ncbi:MAG TPA: cupin domain-containing protein [Gemmatimonadaceae bacterium]|nr:cupin domain-containing protein [Gemmatimonadaceae bacterium]